MKNKMNYIIGEFLQNRRLGEIGKFSTHEDVIRVLGIPHRTQPRRPFKYKGFFLCYGNVGILISGIKHRVLKFDISNLSEDDFDFGPDFIFKDFEKFKNLNEKELKNYLLEFGIEIVEEKKYDDKILKVFISNQLLNFRLVFDNEENKFYSLEFEYNYHSKKINV